MSPAGKQTLRAAAAGAASAGVVVAAAPCGRARPAPRGDPAHTRCRCFARPQSWRSWRPRRTGCSSWRRWAGSGGRPWAWGPLCWRRARCCRQGLFNNSHSVPSTEPARAQLEESEADHCIALALRYADKSKLQEIKQVGRRAGWSRSLDCCRRSLEGAAALRRPRRKEEPAFPWPACTWH